MENFSPENAVDAEKARIAADGSDASDDLMDDRFEVTLNPDKVIFDTASLFAAADSFAAMTLTLDRDMRENFQGGQTAKEREERARSNTDNFVHMMQLQSARIETRIAELDAEIAGYDADLLAIARDIFTDEEMAEFDALPEDEKWEAMDKAMREKLENGEITQEEYDQWAKTYADRLEAVGKRDEFNERYMDIRNDPNLTDAEKAQKLEELFEVYRPENTAIASREMDGATRMEAEASIESDVDLGRSDEQTRSDESLLSMFSGDTGNPASAAQRIDPVQAEASLRPSFTTAVSEPMEVASENVRDFRPQGPYHPANA